MNFINCVVAAALTSYRQNIFMYVCMFVRANEKLKSRDQKGKFFLFFFFFLEYIVTESVTLYPRAFFPARVEESSDF